MPTGRGIPHHVQASSALARGGHYEGILPFQQLPRLAEQLADRDGGLEVSLQAGKDEHGAAWLKGKVRGVLRLPCQRGLHPFEWPCDVSVELRLVSTEAEEQKLLKDCEPYWVRDDELPLRELVEDEVLLALPITARCEDPDCGNRVR